MNLQLKLLCYPLITTSNNLSYKICCENVVDIAFLLKKKNIYIYIYISK